MTKHLPHNNARANNWTFGVILLFAAIGLLASFILSNEKIELLKNPDAVLSCSINVVLNCASVIKTWQATVFGFPNSFIGLMAYPVLITLAVGYFAGARYKKWFYVGVQAGALLGLVFAYWLFFQSVFVIEVLCPWCLVVTFSTTMIFEAITRYNLRENNFNVGERLHQKIIAFLHKDWDKLLVAAWTVGLALMIVIKFPNIFG